MGLINCPDCDCSISDAADKCIHCGRPLRLSREAILAEIRIKKLELQEIWRGIDNYIDSDDHDYDYPGREQVYEKNCAARDDCQKRLEELEAMLK